MNIEKNHLGEVNLALYSQKNGTGVKNILYDSVLNWVGVNLAIKSAFFLLGLEARPQAQMKRSVLP